MAEKCLIIIVLCFNTKFETISHEFPSLLSKHYRQIFFTSSTGVILAKLKSKPPFYSQLPTCRRNKIPEFIGLEPVRMRCFFSKCTLILNCSMLSFVVHVWIPFADAIYSINLHMYYNYSWPAVSQSTQFGIVFTCIHIDYATSETTTNEMGHFEIKMNLMVDRTFNIHTNSETDSNVLT